MWWTRDEVYLYDLRLRLPPGAGPSRFSLTPGSDLVQRAAR
jgi:hypothetical protein